MAVKDARDHADPGDVILFSPAFASFGMFVNEYDRGDRFMEVIKEL
jgi:UDP-N-acetylmuramoylalanine--D-glutamate ligase